MLPNQKVKNSLVFYWLKVSNLLERKLICAYRSLNRGHCQTLYLRTSENVCMISASYNDKTFIVDLLSRAFDDNKSVNYVLPQDRRRRERIRHLMSYSLEVCHHFSKIYRSEEGKGCAMVLFPEQQKTDLTSLLLDFKLITRSIGLSHVRKAISRESAIKKRRPQEPLYYLWFIGVEHGERGKGIGRALLNGIIQEAEAMNRSICLETSAPKNLPWYQKAGFSIYDELDLGYTLYFLKKNRHL